MQILQYHEAVQFSNRTNSPTFNEIKEILIVNRFSKGAVALTAAIALTTGAVTAGATDFSSSSNPASDVAIATEEAPDTTQDQSLAFEAAMDYAITAEDSESEYADPQLWGAVGKAAWKGATWAGKQVAKGGLTELGKQLIGG